MATNNKIAELKPKTSQNSDQNNRGGASKKSSDDDLDKSAASVLIRIADASLFHNSEGEGFASIKTNGHTETWPLRSRGFRKWLQMRFYEEELRAAPSLAINEALGVIEAKAIYQGPEKDVFLRLGQLNGKIYVDLADKDWRAVEIDSTGWRIIDEPPVAFRRCKGMLPLPQPEQGGSVSQLRRYLNCHKDDFVLIIGWLIQALRPKGPYPILLLYGEQGSAKSTTESILKRLIDPSTTPLRSEPSNQRDFMITASNGWVIAFDNLSRIPIWLSDSMCRLSTGGGFSTREMYRDSDEILFSAQRPLILASIEEIANRSDLLDRCLITYLPQIREDKRKTEKQLWRDFEQAQPRLLGALYDAVSAALENEERVTLNDLPRLADFVIWVTAAENKLGMKSGKFLATYNSNRQSAKTLALDASIIADSIRTLANDRREWIGTAQELLTYLYETADDDERRRRKDQGWPRRPNKLSNELRKLTPNLCSVGVNIKFHRGVHGGKRMIEIRKVPNPSSPSSPPSPGNDVDGGVG